MATATPSAGSIGAVTDGPGSGEAARRTVRLAWAADVPGIAALQYAALVPRLSAEIAAQLSSDDLVRAWRAAVTRPPTARHRVLVASVGAASGSTGGAQVIAPADLGTTGGRVVGFTATAPADDPDAEAGTDGEVVALHAVSADGELIGALLAAAADTLEADGFTRAQLWVATDEDLLRATAEQAGWTPDGAHRRLELADGASGQLSQVRLHTGLTGRADDAEPPAADQGG